MKNELELTKVKTGRPRRRETALVLANREGNLEKKQNKRIRELCRKQNRREAEGCRFRSPTQERTQG